MGDRQFPEAGFLPFQNQNKTKELNTIANVSLFALCPRMKEGRLQRVLPSFTKKKQMKGVLIEPLRPLQNEDQAVFKCRVIMMIVIHETNWTPFLVACLRVL